MKFILSFLTTLSFTSMAQAEIVYQALHECTVTKVRILKYNEMTFPEVTLKKGSKVIVSGLQEDLAMLRAELGKTSIETADDDMVSEKPALIGKAFSIVPNGSEWVMILDIVDGKGVLSYMQMNNARNPFDKFADLDCE